MSVEAVGVVEIKAAGSDTDWVEYFKQAYEKLVQEDLVTLSAVEAFKNMQPVCGSPDTPGESLARVMEAHLKFRRDLFMGLMEFVNARNPR